MFSVAMTARTAMLGYDESAMSEAMMAKQHVEGR
jgi:hypothetical protein